MCLRGEQGAKIDKYMDISVLFFLAVLIFRLYSRKLAKNTGLRCDKRTVVQYCDKSSAVVEFTFFIIFQKKNSRYGGK